MPDSLSSPVRRLFCLAATAAQTRPVPNVALSSLRGAALSCSGRLLNVSWAVWVSPSPFHGAVEPHTLHTGRRWGRIVKRKCHLPLGWGHRPQLADGCEIYIDNITLRMSR